MKKIVASLFVPVALITTAASPFTGPTTGRPLSNDRAEMTAALSSNSREYLIESNFDVNNTAELRKVSSGRPVRRVLLTGYHPVDGFAVEMASARAAYASADPALERAGGSQPRDIAPRVIDR